MSAYEWFKAVVLLPWAAFRLVASVLGLILVWFVTRVRRMMPPAALCSRFMPASGCM